MKFLIFGKFSFNHIYFLFYPLTNIIKYILTNIIDNKKIAKDFYLIYITILSRFLAFIPYIIKKSFRKKRMLNIKMKTVSVKLITYIMK